MKMDGMITENMNNYCLACLSTNDNMYDLNENIEKGKIFENVFNTELNIFQDYPHFLCFACEIKLDITYKFCQKVRKNLLILEEYNKKVQSMGSKEDMEKEFNEDGIQFYIKKFKTEDNIENSEVSNEKTHHRDTSRIKIVNPDEVNRVITEFKNKFSENKTCKICGFIAENRRSISSHMGIFHKDIKNRWCWECNDIFENYEQHKESHSSRHQCPFCARKITLYHYVEHLQSHSGTFACQLCNKTFKSAAWLTKHSQIHTNYKPHVCPNCSKGFIQLTSLRYHLDTHGKFACESCKKHYKTEKYLKEHECTSDLKVIKEIWVNSDGVIEDETEPAEIIIIKGDEVVDSDVQNFCKDCNKRVRSLKQHIEKYHTAKEEPKVAVERIKCEFCQKTFSDAYKLKTHKRMHTGQLPHKCECCDKRFQSREKLKDHQQTHTKEKPYICNVCGKGLSQSSALRTHMKQHTGRPEVCNLCGKKFCRKSELKLHLSKHMGEKPFLCTDCGKTFAQRSHLSEHMVRHSEERPFGCTHCDKSFKAKNLLKEHSKLHKGHKPFQCPTCMYACYRSYRLQQHMKLHLKDSYENIVVPKPVPEPTGDT